MSTRKGYDVTFYRMFFLCTFLGNGVIDFEEFSAWMKQHQVAISSQDVAEVDQREMRRFFQVFDKDNDG